MESRLFFYLELSLSVKTDEIVTILSSRSGWFFLLTYSSRA